MSRGLARLPKQVKVKIMGEVEPDPKDAKEGKEPSPPEDYELEDAARTLTRAEEIKADPHMMKHLGPHLAKKAKAYKSLSELKQMSDSVKAVGK